MSNKNGNNDIFLKSIGAVKKLKKSNKHYKSHNLLKTKKISFVKTSKELESKDAAKQDTSQNVVKKKINAHPSVEKKIRKGKLVIDRKIDFHGLSLNKAKQSFVFAINECFYSNTRRILFITGKGISKSTKAGTSVRLFHGKIRENFQRWIYEEDVATKILYVAPAGPQHGGDGAFFVYLRKNKN